MKKVFSILDEKPFLSEKGETSPATDNEKVIEFKNVDFSYGRELVLKNINFVINLF